MSFYLFLPLYAAIIARRHRAPEDRLARELYGLAVLVAIGFIFRVWNLTRPAVCHNDCLTRPPLVRTMVTWLPSYFDLFALGMLLAVLSAWFIAHDSEPAWLRHRSMPWISWAIALGAFWAVSHLGISPTPVYIVAPGVNIAKQTLYGIVAFFVVMPAVFGPQDKGGIRRLLRWKPIALFGLISYGIYLWHQAWVTEFFKWTGVKVEDTSFLLLTGFVLVMAILSAGVSYVVVERPALNMKNQIRGRSDRPDGWTLRRSMQSWHWPTTYLGPHSRTRQNDRRKPGRHSAPKGRIRIRE